MASIELNNSALTLPQDVQSSSPIASTDTLTAQIHLRRRTHANGMSLQEYADAVIAGQQPILGREEFNRQFGADQADIDAASAFLTSKGLTVEEVRTPSACLTFSGTVASINDAFGITLASYTTPTKTFMAFDGPVHIPAELQGIVNHVTGLESMGSLKPNYVMSPQPDGKAMLDPSITTLNPLQVATAYQMPAGDGEGQTIGIVSFGGGYLSTDITNSFSAISVTPPSVTDVSYLGATNSPGNGADVENMLDIFCAGAVAPKAKIYMYFSPNTLGNFGGVIDYAIHDTARNPSIITISWGTDELAFQTYSALFESILQSAVVLGVTIMQACGDYGSEAVSGDTAGTVQYPSSSPYCLGIGGTALTLDGSNNIVSETVWDQGNASTGGGLSHIFNAPSFQSGLTYSTYNAGTGVTGSPTALDKRGVPDISANAAPASGYSFYANGAHYVGVGGTSASSPLLAGCFARLQAKLGRRFGSPISLFYSNTDLFKDITSGNNASPATTGYAATTGWDACTGLGTPIGNLIYKKLNIGTTYPKGSKGKRPLTGAAYPRPRIRD